MNARVLAIALAVSVAVNLFAVAAGVTVMVGQSKVERQLEQAQRPGRDRSMREVLATVECSSRHRQVRTTVLKRPAQPSIHVPDGGQIEEERGW